ncbi:MAG: hypothetical protein DBW89_03155 [Halieaceae bacterium]|nr:MAG: hypothetical protein DBW89_03155 [Halieaceae bacterium]
MWKNTRDNLLHYWESSTVALLSQVMELPIQHMVTIVSAQAQNMTLARFVRGVVDGEVEHPLLCSSARMRLKCSLQLHCLAHTEPLRETSSHLEWHAIEAYLTAELSGLSRERFVALFLDAQCKLLSSEVLFFGTIDSAVIYTRVVATRALANHAVSVVVAHNHPSGSLTPSRSDIDVTIKLAKSLQLLDIRLLDHLIVAGGRCASLRNLGFV